MYEPLCVHHVRLLFNMAEVLGLTAFVGKTPLVAVEHDVVGSGSDIAGEVDRLRNISK